MQENEEQQLKLAVPMACLVGGGVFIGVASSSAGTANWLVFALGAAMMYYGWGWIEAEVADQRDGGVVVQGDDYDV